MFKKELKNKPTIMAKSSLSLKQAELKELDRNYRNYAVQLVKGWGEEMMKNFKEPVRAGVKKGDAIGFTREKMKASLFSMLYPSVSLKRIAILAGCSYGMLLVWRTEPKFREQVEKNILFWGEAISNTIELAVIKTEIDFLKEKGGIYFSDLLGLKRIEVLRSERKNKASFIKKASKSGGVHLVEVDDTETTLRKSHLQSPFFNDDFEFAKFLLDLLPYFDPSLSKPFIDLARTKIEQDPLSYYPTLLCKLYSSAQIRVGMNPVPNLRETLKDTLVTGIDVLTDPESRKSIADEGLKNLGALLQKLVSDLFDTTPSQKEGKN